MNAAEKKQWIREQYLLATKYLADKGMVTESVNDTESRYLVPLVAIWKINLLNQSSVWVICGDLPSDHSSIDVATSAREAVRHFSFKWQMQAENLLAAEDKEQHEYAQLLVGRAEGLYSLYEKEELWQAVS